MTKAQKDLTDKLFYEMLESPEQVQKSIIDLAVKHGGHESDLGYGYYQQAYKRLYESVIKIYKIKRNQFTVIPTPKN